MYTRSPDHYSREDITEAHGFGPTMRDTPPTLLCRDKKSEWDVRIGPTASPLAAVAAPGACEACYEG